jgi:uncharacterized membrane protein (UPF0127 family)
MKKTKSRKIKLNSKVKQIRYCKSTLSKSIGLMFSKPKDLALVFIFSKENSLSLHMLFVFYKIDIFWLDKHKRVTFVKKGCFPFTFIQARPAQYIIEARTGLLDLKVGDKIMF